MKKININDLSTGQLVDCADHIEVSFMDVMGVETRRVKLSETTDSVKELCVEVKKYLAKGRYYNSGLHSYLESQGVVLPSRDRKPQKYGEVPAIMKFEKQASNG